MESPAHSPAPARSSRGRALRALGPPRPFALLALGVALSLAGCGAGASQRQPQSSESLVAGKRAAPIPPAQLARAAGVARRFAYVYARSIYLPRPPSMPGTTATVQRELSAVATRVPLDRRSRQPRVGGLRLIADAVDRLDASVIIVDGLSPRFSIGFTVRRRAGRWQVTSISAPE